MAAFINGLDRGETLALTRAMVEVGDRLSWPVRMVVDKHSVGGLPGNRTTPIVVAIVAAAGLTIPAGRWSRAIRWQPVLFGAGLFLRRRLSTQSRHGPRPLSDFRTRSDHGAHQ